jgi:flagella basal body P-ring formation protein FlgA
MEASSNVQALSAAMLVGATARRDLASHSQVLARDVVREKAVKEGETLALEIFNGRIRVKTKVMALADGYIGDVVTVQTLSNGKKLTVRVTQNGRVQLRLGTDQIH